MELHNSGVSMMLITNYLYVLSLAQPLMRFYSAQLSILKTSLYKRQGQRGKGGILGAWELSTSPLACRHPRLLLSPTSLSTSVPSPDLLPTHAMGLSPLQSSFYKGNFLPFIIYHLYLQTMKNISSRLENNFSKPLIKTKLLWHLFICTYLLNSPSQNEAKFDHSIR